MIVGCCYTTFCPFYRPQTDIVRSIVGSRVRLVGTALRQRVRTPVCPVFRGQRIDVVAIAQMVVGIGMDAQGIPAVSNLTRCCYLRLTSHQLS